MSRAMKNSGIPWIGEIPSHWRIEQIGSCIKEVNCPNANNAEDNALQFKMGTIISKKDGDSKYNPETLEAYNKVRKGDIILNGLNLSFDFISQRVGLVKEDGVITSTYLALRPLPFIDSRFLNYLFKGYDYCKALHSMGRGLRATLAYNEFRKYSVIFPSISEQQAIADFLDKKCGEIDEMISLQEKIIEELKAYKQSVITEAVCRGLNPDVPMKDSGIEWIGRIPEGWRVLRIKNLSRFYNGYAFDSNAFRMDNAIPVIRIGDISTTLDYDLCVKVDYSTELSAFVIQEGDVLIAMSGATTGKCCLVSNPQMAYINQRVGIIRGSWNRFIFYALQAAPFFEYVCLNSAGSAQPNISSAGIGNHSIAVPDKSTALSIADYLDEKCKEIDTLISVKQSKIDALKEYKKSIIYEYITGKREVL